MWSVCVWVCVCLCARAGVWGVRGEHTEPRCTDAVRCRYVGGRRTDNEREFSLDEQNIMITHIDGRYLEVKCKGWAALDSAALPSFSSALRVPRVTLSDCPPPDVGAGGSFARTLLALNVTLLRSCTQGNLTLVSLPPHPPLRAEHFAGLDDLVELKLIGKFGRVRPTPVAEFLAGLQRLQTLVVLGVLLPPGELEHPPVSLQVLKLKHAGMLQIPEAVLTLPKLSTLELEEKLLKRFSIPQKLRTLSLETKNNTLVVKEIPVLETLILIRWKETRPEPLVRCDALRALKLASPALKTLPECWVALCPHLEYLALTNAIHLTSLSPKLLQNATSLKHLTLTNSMLGTLPKGLLDDVQNLLTLDLRHNHLTTITSGAFAGPAALQSLDLSDNLLTAHAPAALAPLHSLTHLSLARNPRLADLCAHSLEYSPLLHLKKLSSLSLVKTNITCICRDWRENLTLLNTLDLRSTKITVLRFSDLQYVRNDTITDADVLLEGSPVAAVQYSEDDYKASLTATSGAKVQLDEDSRLQCDCSMYWTRLALFPVNNESGKLPRVTGLRCSDKRPLRAVPLEELVCRADAWCRRVLLPAACECSARPAAGRRVLVRVRCEGTALTRLPQLPHTPEVVYDLLLANNNISELRIADLPPNWMKLDVRNNSLKVVDAEVGRALLGSRRRLQLAGNPLECSCSAAPLLLALHSAGAPASDLRSASCYGGGALHDASTTLCARVPLAIWLIVVLAVLLASSTTLFAYFAHPKHRILIQIILDKLGLLRQSSEPDDIFYDVFLSFSHQDEEIVLQLVKWLERGPKPYRACVHYRDWVPGRLISDQIVESVRLSQRTLAVVSRTFLKSTWARTEFREALGGVARRLIVVLLEDPADLDLDDELHRHVTTVTYLRWGDPWFWDKLRLALPRPRGLPDPSISLRPSAWSPVTEPLLEPSLQDNRLTVSIDGTKSSPSECATTSLMTLTPELLQKVAAPTPATREGRSAAARERVTCTFLPPAPQCINRSLAIEVT